MRGSTRIRADPTTIEVTPIPDSGPPKSVLETDFGKLLETVMAVPGALGVVLSDDGGYAIDYVFHPTRLDALDIQIIGAQLIQPIQRVIQTATAHGLAEAVIVLESKNRRLLCAGIDDDYVLGAMLAGQTNLALAMRRFEVVRSRLCDLMAV